MIDLDYIRSFFPPVIARESRFDRYMLKEYLQLLILDHLATTPFITKLTFIGGTNLRLIQGIDRFSEDLDFDCTALSGEEFTEMTDGVVRYLRQNNIDVETRDRVNPRLTAFRRNLYFPEMLFGLGLSGHRDERLLLKIEAQDQGVCYTPEVASVNRMGTSSRWFSGSVPTTQAATGSSPQRVTPLQGRPAEGRKDPATTREDRRTGTGGRRRSCRPPSG